MHGLLCCGGWCKGNMYDALCSRMVGGGMCHFLWGHQGCIMGVCFVRLHVL